MNPQKKKAEPKRKLTLNRETLRALEINEPNLLEGVVGGEPPRNTPDSDCYICDTRTQTTTG